MLAFQALFHQLDQVTGTRAKVLLLVEHFRSVPAADAARRRVGPDPGATHPRRSGSHLTQYEILVAMNFCIKIAI